jgi:hypothetical protein
MKKDKHFNVFISHYKKDEENILKLKILLASKGYILKNSSIDSTKRNRANNEEYVKGLLRPCIDWAGTVICLIGPKTHTRQWVDWEIEQAFKMGKRIVGVYINGANDSDVPENFEKYGNSLVGWDTERIIGAIVGKVTNFENSSGSTRAPYWRSIRYKCI